MVCQLQNSSQPISETGGWCDGPVRSAIHVTDAGLAGDCASLPTLTPDQECVARCVSCVGSSAGVLFQLLHPSSGTTCLLIFSHPHS